MSTSSITELSFDVSEEVPFEGERIVISGTLHEPTASPRAVLVCWPGGSYDRRYWQFDAAPGYSFAEHMSAQGFAVVAADHLGVGASSAPADVDSVTLEAMARAAGAFAAKVRDLYETVPLVGVGHSLGGCISVMTQALTGAYDRVACVGYNHGAKDAVTADASGAADARAAAVEQAQAFFADWDAGYAIAPREPNHPWLYAADTPADVIAADDATVTRWPRQAYVEALHAGFTAPYAPKVECPLLLAFGDHDIPEHPHDEVAFYTGSRDVTLYVLEDAAHCHNFAATRTRLWDRIGAWIDAEAPTLQ
jgi:alpha-beta hydrolase superfamily lysophospholipase